ncbi:MAG: VWA domain-containing protein [Blastocatellia bacterium]|nr:VWA domain-containing protein [Blastocatellia bacterium]
MVAATGLRRLLTLLCCFLLSWNAPASLAQDQQPQDQPLQIEATVVNVPVIVSDFQGRHLAGLTKAVFTLYDNDIRQEISFFETAEAPLNVAILIDTSKSTRDVLGNIKKAAKKFLKQLRPQDQAMVMSFDADLHLLTHFTSNRKQLEEAVNHAREGEFVGTVLKDAVQQTIRQYLKSMTGRKAVILLTDGKDHGSGLSDREFFDLVVESDAMMFPIFYRTEPIRRMQPMQPPWGRIGRRRGGIWIPRIPPPERPQRRERVERQNQTALEFLEKLADNTAGRLFEGEVKDVEKAFEHITEELRSQYVLGFYPEHRATGGSKHRLRVQVSQTEVAVRARKYYQP